MIAKAQDARAKVILAGLFLVIMEVLNEYGAVKYFGVNTLMIKK